MKKIIIIIKDTAIKTLTVIFACFFIQKMTLFQMLSGIKVFV